jgi:hypothetical protein
MTATTTATKSPSSVDLGALSDDLRSWWSQEGEDWDTAVMGADPRSLPGGDDLWDDMPKVDSKAIARSSPIFARHLGVSLDVKLIRPGGYASIDEAIADLVPRMAAVAAQKLGNS